VNKITARTDSWLVKNLSFAGRLQVLSSVLLSIQVFWAKVFILPKRIIRLIERNSIDCFEMAEILRHMLRWLGTRFLFLNKKGVLASRILKFGIRLPCLIIYETYFLKLAPCG